LIVKLSPNFTLAELTVTQTGLTNEPPPDTVDNLRILAAKLEEVRAALGGKPIRVNSAYRSPAVNKAVGGSAKSSHMTGLAVDFICQQFGPPLEVCKAIEASGIKFDQLINEVTWVHLGIGPQNRQQVLTIDRHGVRAGLLPVRR
jgi:zinc D-Ala-D-Ala carboxypeptidase